MKKSLIALAVLAASGAAMAQSSVQLYGIVDAFVGTTQDTIKTPGSKSQTVVESGGLKSSRWGMRGTEDLGGGLKAGFKLEQRFKTDTGALDGVNFKGESSINLSGNFGTVALGRMGTPYDDLRGKTNPIADTNISPVGDTIKNAKVDYTDKTDNTVAYVSPTFNGFSGAVAVSLGENKTNVADATSHTSLKLQYANGPLLVGYGFQKEESQLTAGTPAVATGQTEDKTFNLLAASYDFGVAKLVGGYQSLEIESKGVKQGDSDSLYFGVQAPVASNINVFFGYAGSKYDAVTGTDFKTTGYTLAANYVLSKRTDAYVGYKHIKKENDNTGADLGKVKTLAVGVRHAF
ncbi:porin [Malikia granosa]|uniref:Porin n=1 Tax=Malikia granosa TaxID=263067 RepID=A0A2S9K596_9BURK|nr:porin [Malikia granosa]PRD65626.1 porin [Malikia granosa]